MSKWKECKLDEVVQFQRGHDLTQSQMISGPYPVAGSNGIIDYHNKFTTNGPGITLGRSGNSIGVAHYYETDFWAHNTTLYSKNFIDSDPKFVYFLLKTIDFKTFDTGSAVPSLNRNHIHLLDICIPPLPEQRAIASVLSSLDDKIDLLNRQNKTLEAMAETLFRQWFVEEAEVSWEERTIGDIVTVVSGTTPKTENPEFWNGEFYWTSPRDITNLNGIFLFDTERKITKKGLEQIGSGLLPAGSLLMSSRAPVGALALAEIPVAINQGYAGIICDKGFSREFIYLWLKNNMDYVQAHANGSTFQEISKSTFRSLKIIIPGNAKCISFQTQVLPMFGKMKKNSNQIRTLEKLRDTLLPKLMNGEVRVAV
jgi:type I restriction enzyme S subunit